MTQIDCTPSQLAAALSTAIRANLPVMIWGDGGLGKSRIAEQVAAALERDYFDFRAMIKDLPDLQGYPVVGAMQAGAACPMTAPAGLPPQDLARASVLVLEELTAAPRMVMGALYGLVLERRLNEYTLPADCAVIATGNMATSGGISNAMPKPLASRFLHLRLICTPDEHLAYARRASWSPFVVAYHELTNGRHWMQFDAKSTEETYACPRSWEMVSDLLGAGPIPQDIAPIMLAGSLGYGIGSEFSAFLGLFASLAPTIAAMRQNPAACTLPAEVPALWFLSAAIVQQATPVDCQWIMPLLARFPRELSMSALDSIRHRNAQCLRTPEFMQTFGHDPDYAALAAVL